MFTKTYYRIALLFLFCSASSAFAQVQGPGETTAAVQHDVSDDLRHVQPQPPQAGQKVFPAYHLPASLGPDAPDPALQTQTGATTAPAIGLGFDGVGVGFSGPQGAFSPNAAPPDTNGAVGDTQYVQWVNESFAVFDKTTGNPVWGPITGNTLWAGFGGKCQTNNDGDPIVQYDKAANRWIFTQFAVSGGGGYLQCIAISTTHDATGPYYRYAFSYPYFNDYPKLGVWPDAYYMTFNLFRGNSFVGPRACALDRTQMLQGKGANQVCFQFNSNVGSLLPSDLDGATAPPAGSPNYIVTAASNSLNIYKFHVDFVTPSNSTMSTAINIPVAAFSLACGGGACIPQLGTSQLLDSLGDRLMYRFAYRNFGDHGSLVVNHSIATPGAVGVRWYEIQVSPSGALTLFQQGTYAPTSDYRWMGSIAMDHVGNIALGYSVSSSTQNPAIRYTARVPGDTPGQMGTETTVINGTGSQSTTLNRWGDYSAMSIDPVDDCTFWYTNEYIRTTGTFNWSTRIAKFSMPGCGTPTLTATTTTLGASPTSSTYGDSVSFTATVSPAAATGNVQFFDGATSLGPAVTLSSGGATFATSSLAGGSHTITATYSGDTTYAGSTSNSLNYSVAKASTSVALGANPTSSTFGQSVTFTATVAPSGAGGTVQFLDGSTVLGSGTLSGVGVATFATSSLAAGTHTITATYAGDANFNGSSSNSVTQTVNPVVGTFALSASPSPLPITRGTTGVTTISVTPSGGFTGNVTLSVTGLPNGSSATFSPVTVNITDTNAKTSSLSVKTSNGTKSGTYMLTVTGSGGGSPVTISLTVK